MAKVKADIAQCLVVANSEASISPRSAAFALRRLCGYEPQMWFEMLASTLMSESGDLDLLRFNPYLQSDKVVMCRDLLIGLMLRWVFLCAFGKAG